MKRDDRLYFQYILDAITQIESYVRGMDESDFIAQRLNQDGVIRQLEIIGEAVKKVTLEIKQQYPEIPWQDIAGMRDKLIHDYFGVDLKRVWYTVQDDLPALKHTVLKVLGYFSDLGF